MQRAQVLTDLNSQKGVFLSLLGYFFISLIGICEKSISPDISVPTILFFQNFICFFLVIGSLLKSKNRSLKIKNPSAYIIRIASGLTCYATLFYIIRYIPISEALLYQYSASLWIPFIMLVWFKVFIDKTLWWGIIIGFIGILLVLNPSSSVLSMVSLIGVICGIAQAISVVVIRVLLTTETTERILFYYFLVGSCVMFPLMIKSNISINWHDALLLVGVGLNTFAGQNLLTTAFRYANPATLAPICYMNILYSGVIGWIFWHETPHSQALLGMVLIIIGCLFTMIINSRDIQPTLSLSTEAAE